MEFRIGACGFGCRVQDFGFQRGISGRRDLVSLLGEGVNDLSLDDTLRAAHASSALHSADQAATATARNE
eukprot:2228111-Rhodomonas_salina.1